MILPQAILDAPRTRLPQPPCLATAALARRGADPARDHGRRRRNRRRGHEDGGGTRYRPGRHGRERADRARHECRRVARPPHGPRRRPHGARPRGALARRPDLHAAARGGRHLRPQDHERGWPYRLVEAGLRGCTTSVRGLSPFPGAFFSADFGKGPERVKVLRSATRRARAHPGRCSTPSARRRVRRGGVASPAGAAAPASRPWRRTNSCAARGSARQGLGSENAALQARRRI